MRPLQPSGWGSRARAVATLAFLFAGGAAFDGHAAAAAPGDGRTPAQLRKEVLERLHTLRDWRIVDALELDEAAAARLLPVLARYDERELTLATERRDIVRGLRAEVSAAHPDDARLTAGIGLLLANRARRRALEDERIGELRHLLTPLQQVKLLLLLPRLEREFSQRVRDAVKTRGKPGGAEDDAFAP